MITSKLSRSRFPKFDLSKCSNVNGSFKASFLLNRVSISSSHRFASSSGFLNHSVPVSSKNNASTVASGTSENDSNLQPFELEAKPLWEDLSDDEITRIRDCSGLDDESKELENRQLSGPRKFYMMREYKTTNIREFYALYGKDSGLKPGICWPSREELDFRDKFEKTFYPTLEKLMKDNEEEKARIAKMIKDREDEVSRKLADREKIIADFLQRRADKLAQEEEIKKRNEKMVAEVREYLGFNIEKSDPRFQEALAKKEEEERLQAKAKVKKDKNAKMAELLHKMLDLPVEELSKPRQDSQKNEKQNEGSDKREQK